MANLSRSLSTFLVVVGFLVLTALAAVLYGGSTAQQEKMKQNVFWQGSRQVVDNFWLVAAGLGKAGSDRGEEKVDSQAIEAPEEGNLWLNFQTRLAQERSANEIPPVIRWQKTETGAEIIFRSESGQEHKLRLPFKFLSL